MPCTEMKLRNHFTRRTRDCTKLRQQLHLFTRQAGGHPRELAFRQFLRAEMQRLVRIQRDDLVASLPERCARPAALQRVVGGTAIEIVIIFTRDRSSVTLKRPLIAAKMTNNSARSMNA